MAKPNDRFKNLAQRMSGIKPFVTFKFRGIDDCLVDPETGPLHVNVVPPNMTFIIESGIITTLITRYSKTFQSSFADIGKPNGVDKASFTSKVMEEVNEAFGSTNLEQLKQVNLIVQVGAEYLAVKSTVCWYDGDEPTPITFVRTVAEAAEKNQASEDGRIFVAIDALIDTELINVGTVLMSALPTEEMPMVDIATPEIKDNGEVTEGVTSSVQAGSVASFRRSTRGLVVEDVSKPSREAVGDSERLLET